MYAEFKKNSETTKTSDSSDHELIISNLNSKEPHFWQRILKERGRDVQSREDTQNFAEKPDTWDASRIARIFISSTFKDFYWERETLIRQVFPRLRTWCEERNIYLIECDLRWGVPREATGQEAILTCLEEIDRCREEMSGNCFFLSLIGERYGWVPTLEEVGERISEKYSWIEGASVTLMEIIHGALRTLSPNSLFMLRQSDIYSDLDKTSLSIFCESEPSVRDNMRCLRGFLDATFSPLTQLEHYTCTYAGMEADPVSGRNRVKFVEYEVFSEKAFTFFTNAIDRVFKKTEMEQSREPQDNEDQGHMVTLRALTRLVQGNDNTVQQVTSEFSNEDTVLSAENNDMERNTALAYFEKGHQMLALKGPAGSGKSTAMARLILHYSKVSSNRVFYHFIGNSVSSKLDDSIVDRFEAFVNREFPSLQLQSKSVEGHGDKKKKFAALLQRIVESCPENQVYIFIDALDELTSATQQLDWLPFNFPSNVHCVVSLLDTPGSLWNSLSDRDVKALSVDQLTEMDSRAVAEAFFRDFGKRLDSEQMKQLILHSTSGNPLWLMQACEELRIHGDYSSLNKAIANLPDSINDLNRQILRRLIDQDTSGLTKLFFQVLHVSRIGIWETEVRKILSNGDGEIPQSTWHATLRGLKSFVHVESVPIPVIKFRHRIMKEAVFEELFTNEEAVETLHGRLATYYETQCTSSNIKHQETCYHLFHSYQRTKLVKLLKTKDSYAYLPKRLTRTQIMTSMRCHMMTNSSQKENALKICMFCAGMANGIGIRHQDACIFCGHHSFGRNEARICTRHESQNFLRKNNCMVCERPLSMGKSLPAHVCPMCVRAPSQCCTLVLENDNSFANHKQLTKYANVYW